MNIQELKKIIPEAELEKDYFGADYFYITYNILTKRKAWSLLKQRGFQSCPNKQYLRKDDIYVYNNHLKDHLTIAEVKK